MDIGGTHPVVQQVLAEFLGHAFGEGGHEDAFTTMAAGEDLVHQVVNLVLALSDFNFRIQKACGPDDLFHHDTFCFSQFVIGRCGTDIDDLIDHLMELIESQRTVVEGGRQTETVFH